MENVSEKKSVKFDNGGIDEISFETHFDILKGEKIVQDRLSFDIAGQFELTPESNISLYFDTKIIYKPNSDLLVQLNLKHNFFTQDLRKIEGKIDIPDIFIQSLIDISVNQTRGYLLGRLAKYRTEYGSIIFPVFDNDKIHRFTSTS